MPIGPTTLPSSDLNAKLVYIFSAVWSLNTFARGYILASILAIVLFFYYMVMDALIQIVSSILDLWSTSSPLSRILLICLTVYIVRRISPFIKKLHRKGVF